MDNRFILIGGASATAFQIDFGESLPQGWDMLINGLTTIAEYQYLTARRFDKQFNLKESYNHSQSLDLQTAKELRSIFSNGDFIVEQEPNSNYSPGIHTIWVSDRTFNAAAIRCSNKYVVTINIAIPILLYRFFREFVKLPDFFPEIDGIEIMNYKEPILFDTFNPYVVNQEMSIKEAMYWAMGFDNSSRSMRTTKKRLLLAEFLSILCTRIIISHEIGHIISGHTDYIYKNKIPIVTELNSIKNNYASYNNPFIRTLWEVEADINSINILANYEHIEILQKNYDNYFTALGLPNTKMEFMSIYSLCVNILFILLGNIQKETKSEDIHPHFFTRLRILLYSFYWSQYNDESYYQDFVTNCWDKYRNSRQCALDSVPYKSENDFSLGRKKSYEDKWNAMDDLLNSLQFEKVKWKEYKLQQ